MIKRFNKFLFAAILTFCSITSYCAVSVPLIKPMGFNNMGSTCFINASLQGILNQPGLCALIRPLQHIPGIRHTLLSYRLAKIIEMQANAEEAGQEITMNTSSLVKEVRRQLKLNYRVVGYKEKQVKKRVVDKNGQNKTTSRIVIEEIASHPQEDAHEFLTRFFDQIKQENNGQPVFNNQLHDCLYLQQSSRRSCPCGYVHQAVHEGHSITSIPIDERTTNVSECLNSEFLVPEQLHNSPCPNCSQTENCQRRSFLNNTPRYLILSLGRFLFNPQNPNCPSKNTRKILIQHQLDIAPYLEEGVVVPEGQTANYHLNSIIMHSGELNSGHYTAYVRKNGLWYHCNDSRVRQVTPEEITGVLNGIHIDNGEPYILFYEQTPAGVPHVFVEHPAADTSSSEDEDPRDSKGKRPAQRDKGKAPASPTKRQKT